VALALVAGACTNAEVRRAVAPRPGGAAARGSGELTEQAETTQLRIEATEEARSAGVAGVIEPQRGAPAPGWDGETLIDRSADDWEPAIAADPNAPFVYILHNRYGDEPACARRCPDPAMILHVSTDGARTWRPDRYLCVCRGVKGQFDPVIEVVPETGDVYAVWMNDWHIQFSRSSDHGRTWSDPLFVHPGVRWGDKPNLALSSDGADVYVLFNGPTGGDVYAAVSDDAGASWSTDRVTESDRYFFDYGGAVLPSGRVVFGHVSFSYTGPGDAAEGLQQVHVLASDDGGATWTDTVVDGLELGVECRSRGCYADFYDSGPALASDLDGNLVIIYNGASRPFGPQTVYARSSTDGGITWSDRVPISRLGVNAAFPAAVGHGHGRARVWFMDQRTGRWNVWFTTTLDLGTTWSRPVRISDARSGTDYKDAAGFAEVYGDYGEIAITSSGRTVAVWGEGSSFAGPGGVWYNRGR
jgi:hypothetical protein